MGAPVLRFVASCYRGAYGMPESLKGDSEGKEILVDFLLLLILNAADIIEELGKFCTK
jgi:hypothetical protein